MTQRRGRTASSLAPCRGATRRGLLAVLAAALWLLVPARAEAYPFMIKHGYSTCSTCHVDPSGGELLTPYGRMLSAELLSTDWPRPKPEKKRSATGAAPRASGRVVKRTAAPAPATTASTTTSTAPGAPVPPGPSVAPAAPLPALEQPGQTPPPPTAGSSPESASPQAGASEEARAAAAEPPPTATAPVDPANQEAGGSVEASVQPVPDTPPAPVAEPPVAEPPVAEPPVAEPVAEEEEPALDSEEAAAEESLEQQEEEEPSAFSEPFFGLFDNSERFQVGGSLRFASLLRPGVEGQRARFFPMQLDLYGQVGLVSGFSLGASAGVAKVPEGSLHARSAQITSNQGDGYNLISRTHYARFDFGDGAHSVRAGRLNLPFGLRISEHVMWVREQTQTDRESDQQHGVALAMNFENLRFEVMGILGNYQVEPDYYRERGYSAYAEYALFQGAALGVSSLVTRAGDDLTSPSAQRTIRQAHGATLRLALGEAVVMAEADLLVRSRRALGYVGLVQVDYEVLRGVHAIATGELLDSGGVDGAPDREGAGKPRTGGWLSAQWFFLPHFDVRIDAIVRHSDPFQLFSQLHVYL